MKKILLALGLLAAVAAVGWAQTSGTNTVSRNGYYFNATTGNQTNANGEILTQDNLWSRSFTLTNLIADGGLAGTSTLAAAAADSCSPQDTRHMRLGGIVIKCVPVGGGTGLITRLAVQVRTHLNGVADSVNTAPIFFYGNAPVMTATTAVADTSGQGHLFTGSSTVPWSGEFVVTVNGVRNAPGSAVAATLFSYPNAIYIPLSNLWGRDIYSPWTSIRVRNVTGPACQVYVSLVGTPL